MGVRRTSAHPEKVVQHGEQQGLERRDDAEHERPIVLGEVGRTARASRGPAACFEQGVEVAFADQRFLRPVVVCECRKTLQDEDGDEYLHAIGTGR